MTMMNDEPILIYRDHGIELYRLGPLRAELHIEGTKVQWRIWGLESPGTLSQGERVAWDNAFRVCAAEMRTLRDRELAASETAKQRWRD